MPLLGGCLCEAVRYEVRGAPVLIFACHCRDCQKRTGSAYSMGMVVRAADLAIVAGAPLEEDQPTPSGAVTTQVHCAQCHTRLVSKPQRNRNFVTVRPGTLDDTSWLVPTLHIFARSALAGAIPEGATRFETDPPDFAPFAAAFAKIWSAG